MLLLAVVVAGLAMVSGCSETADDPDQTNPGQDSGDIGIGDTDRDRVDVRREIRLALTDWTGSRINVAIAEVLIERRLGYPVTLEPVEGDLMAMLSQLERGELDAALEIWPSSLSDREQSVIEAGRVDDLGPLGIEGRIGWYVPAYVIEDDPTLARWDGYRDTDAARRFATADTEPDGRFLGTDPGYEQFDEELVDALELPFEVVYSGSEDETRRELALATAAREPILLYWWSPTAEIADYGLVKVELPPRTEECLERFADGEPMSCDYAADRLFKLASPTLADTAPELHAFLRNFSLSTEDQTELISRAETGGESIASVAEEWISDNQEVWEPWFSS